MRGEACLSVHVGVVVVVGSQLVASSVKGGGADEVALGEGAQLRRIEKLHRSVT